MKVLICGGGTAGHINPALAIAGSIKNMYSGTQVLFVGTRRGLEASLVPKEGYPLEFIDVVGLRRSLSPRNIVAAFKAFKATFDSKKIIKKYAPDVVIGTGGYVSGPVVKAAQRMGIKTCIHEQNAFWGVTTRLLAKRADRIFLSFTPKGEMAKKYGDKVVVTGNPIRGDIGKFDRGAAKRVLGYKDPVVLSYGGSLGSLTINDAVLAMLPDLIKNKNFSLVHGVGKRDNKYFSKKTAEMNIKTDKLKNIRISEYIYDMPRVMAAADLVVCRSGAITLAELAALGKPSVLIPSPNVTENHQYHNAKVFEDAGAAVIIKDDMLDGKTLYDTITSLLCDEEKLTEMGKCALKLATRDAGKVIAGEVGKLLK